MDTNYLSNVTVLFVDDEDGIRDSFGTLLSMWCKKAYVANDGQNGYEMYKTHQPDIVVTDIRMPKSTGLEMIKNIRESDKEIPILISTAFENSDYLLEAIKLKVSGYLVKPISKKDLKYELNHIAKNIFNEKEIKVKNIQNQLYLDKASSLMVALDKDGNIEMLNKYGCELLGLDEKEIIGKSWFDIKVLPDDTLEEVKEYFFKIINGEVTLSEERYENDLITSDGRRLTLSWINVVIKNEDTITGTFSSAMDITDLKKLEEEKLEHQKVILTQSKVAAVGEMLGNIAHQWRQPLSIISVKMSGLRADAEFNEEVSIDAIQDCAKVVMEQTNYLSKTIEDFRNFYKSNIKLKKPFNIANTISKLQSLVTDSYKNNYINLEVETTEYELNNNENLLIQAFLNICNNSKDALTSNIEDKDRYLFIKVQDDNDFISITFTDSGGGIDENIIDKIFEPYFTTKHEYVGTGLGLYMTNQIITKHYHGSIEAKNVSFTHNDQKLNGAMFSIHLPKDINND